MWVLLHIQIHSSCAEESQRQAVIAFGRTMLHRCSQHPSHSAAPTLSCKVGQCVTLQIFAGSPTVPRPVKVLVFRSALR